MVRGTQNDKFDFQKKLLRYCSLDVDILRKCCLKFIKLFKEITAVGDKEGIDPFQRCITIASACQCHKKKFPEGKLHPDYSTLWI